MWIDKHRLHWNSKLLNTHCIVSLNRNQMLI